MNKTILVVDDSALSRRRFTAGPLREAGFNVVEAQDGQQGIAAAMEHLPDLILMDLLMPVMGGFEMLETLRKQDINAPAIVISADIQESTHNKAMELNAERFLNKPFSKDTLLDVVHKTLAR